MEMIWDAEILTNLTNFEIMCILIQNSIEKRD
ncbi:hypothetical protein SAMN05216170_1125 [Thermococcus thioreducens]|uniref:Uncharacterized protein n=1 Tax=Thermococcus thioreducens TaxID=277988 RepID=A0A1I0N7E4_9EURY|nr:hypothetical protein SAMN05216170_1125 [Thermococcus thioreducens]